MQGEGWPRAERHARAVQQLPHHRLAQARSAQCATRLAKWGLVLRKPAARAVISWQMPKEPDSSSLRLHRGFPRKY